MWKNIIETKMYVAVNVRALQWMFSVPLALRWEERLRVTTWRKRQRQVGRNGSKGRQRTERRVGHPNRRRSLYEKKRRRTKRKREKEYHYLQVALPPRSCLSVKPDIYCAGRLSPLSFKNIIADGERSVQLCSHSCVYESVRLERDQIFLLSPVFRSRRLQPRCHGRRHSSK